MSASYTPEYRDSSHCVINPSLNTAAIVWGASGMGGDKSPVSAQLASGVAAIASTPMAFAALKNDGSVVTWGAEYYGGDSSAVASRLSSGVVAIAASNGAFAALKSDGTVVTWGFYLFGSVPGTKATLLTNVIRIVPSYGAFAALKSNGSVVTWGWGNGFGANSSAVASQLSSGVTSVVSNYSAFAALKSNGSVVTWGLAGVGGDSSSVASQLSSGVVSIVSSKYAFAALKSNGSVVTWGDSAYGGDSSAVSASLGSGVQRIVASERAFAALKTNGSVVTWGDSAFGGNPSVAAASLTGGVTAVVAARNAFAAITNNGLAVAWGGNLAPSRGEAVVLSITASSGSFAYRSSGTISTWGTVATGSDNSAVRINSGSSTSIVATEGAFAALKSDGSVVAWGNSTYGGDASSVSSQLGSRIIGLRSNYNAFVALKEVFTVTYSGLNATAGSVPVDSTVYSGSAQGTILGAGTLTRAGYTLAGWNTAANGTGTTYTVGQQLTITTNLTLYPVWQEQRYTITYNGNSNTAGAVPTDSTGYNLATLATVATAGTLVRTGYEFVSWNTASNGSGTTYTAGQQITLSANLTLYAIWATRCTVTYNKNGATYGWDQVDSTKYLSGSTFTVLEEGTLIKSGAGPFLGWNTAANGSGTNYIPGGIYTISGDITLYAVWASTSAPYIYPPSITGGSGGANLTLQKNNMPNNAVYKAYYGTSNSDVIATTLTNIPSGVTESQIVGDGIDSISSLTNDTRYYFKVIAHTDANTTTAIATSVIRSAVPGDAPSGSQFGSGGLSVATNLLTYTLTWPRIIQGSDTVGTITITNNNETVTQLPGSATSFSSTGSVGQNNFSVVLDTGDSISASVMMTNGEPTFLGPALTSLTTNGFLYTLVWPAAVAGLRALSSIKIFKLNGVSIPITDSESQNAYKTGTLVTTLPTSATRYTGSMNNSGIEYLSVVAYDVSGQTSVLTGGGVFTIANPAFESGNLSFTTGDSARYTLVWPSVLQTSYPLSAIKIYRNASSSSITGADLIDTLPPSATYYNGYASAGTNYYMVEVVDNQNNSSALTTSKVHSSPTSGSFGNAPIPNKILATITGNSYTLYWNSANEGTYELAAINVYANTTATNSPAAESCIAVLSPGGTSYSGFITNDKRHFTVELENITGEKDASLTLYVDSDDVTLSSTSDRLAYTLTWPLVGADVLGIDIYRNMTERVPYMLGSQDGSNLSPSITTFTANGEEGMNYLSFVLNGKNGSVKVISKEIRLSASDSVTVQSVTSTTSSHISMSWSYNGTDTIQSYVIEWSPDSSMVGGTIATNIAGNASSYTGYAPSGTYYVRAKALRVGGAIVSSYTGPITVSSAIQSVSPSPSQTLPEMLVEYAPTVANIAAVESGAAITEELLANATLVAASAGEVAGMAGTVLQVAAPAIVDATGLTEDQQVQKLAESIAVLQTTSTPVEIMMGASQASAVGSSEKNALVKALVLANVGVLAPLRLTGAQATAFRTSIPNVSPTISTSALSIQVSDGSTAVTAPSETDAVVYVMMPPNTAVTVRSSTGSARVEYNPAGNLLLVNGAIRQVGDVITIGSESYIIQSKGSGSFQKQGGGSSGGGGPVCFLGNAPVLTPSGYRRIDSLAIGDMVRTAEGRDVAIQRVKHQRVPAPSAAVNPYVIPKGTWGATENLAISPRHCVAVPDRGMVEARELGLRQLSMKATFDYYNLELPEWENMVVAGVEVESLAPKKRVVMTAAQFRGLVASMGIRTEADLAKLARFVEMQADGRVAVTLSKRERRSRV